MSDCYCYGENHAFLAPEGLPDHIEILPDDVRCDCGEYTWGEMNERLFTRWNVEKP